MGIDGIRPVELELIEVFEQNNRINVTVGEAIDILRQHGHPHSEMSVKDNLHILTTMGFLNYDKDGCRFSLSPNAAKVDLITHCKLPPKPKHQTSDHCDKCGRKFSHGEKPFVRSYSNMELYLCEGCHEPKVVA